MSSINPNTIDGTYPIAGQDNDSQGFRNNFTETKNNFQFAASEITDLQTNAVLKGPLSGGTVDANFNNLSQQPLVAAQIKQFTSTKIDLGPVSSTTTIDWTQGHFQTLTTAGSVNLSFATTWPLTNLYTTLRLQANVTSTSYTISLPGTVLTSFANSIQGYNYATGAITFPSAGIYTFDFTTYDSGATVTIADAFRNADNVTDFAITGNLTTSGARVEAGYQYYSPTGNLAFTANTNVSRIIMDPSGAGLISLYANITLPASNVDATVVTISSTQAVQFLYVQPNTGTTLTNQGNISLAAGSKVEYFYHAVESKWYKVG